MEFASKENTLKIDMFWSEGDENLPNVIVKEEILSDLEPDLTDCSGENKKQDKVSKNNSSQVQESKTFEKKINKPWPNLKKKVKKKNQEDEISLLNEKKLLCIHDMKNLKIFKRRLRCGDCKALVCPECCKILFSTLQNHFSGFDKKSCRIYSCNFCCNIFHSVCALQAHIRIHTMETPYVCPDCGLIYNNIYFLILHLMNKCFHVYKTVRYKCQNCPGSYFTPETFLQHIQNLHMFSMFRCSYCSSLFDNSDEFEKHMDDFHQKQKVQYLNYFRCTLCSNIIVPKFMYEKHIDLHRKNSEFFEVGYQCLCGEVFSLIGSFKAHVQFCNKKGILPPHWLFLQKKLKTHEFISLNNLEEKKKDDLTDSIPKTNTDLQFLKSNLNDKITKEFESSTQPMLPFEEIKNNKSEERIVNSLSKDTISDFSESSKSNFTNSIKSVLNKVLNNFNKLEEKNCGSIKEIPVYETPLDKLKSPMILGKKKKKLSEPECLDESSNFSTNNNNSCQTEEIKKKKEHGEKIENKNNAENIDSGSKVLYDHIPCDHLGYLKLQCSDLSKWESIIAENKSEKLSETSHLSTNYHVVMELDEKTGLMVSKRVDIKSIDQVYDFSSDNVNEEIIESFSSKILSPKHSPDKGKCKMGNSFFTCPFCIVLFPKHNSIFQQFRLHLECYHPDAALNLTINEIDNQSKSDKCNKKSIISGIQPTIRVNKCSDSNHSKKSNLDICEKNYIPEKSKLEKQLKSMNDLKLSDKEDALYKEENKNFDKNGQKKDVFWTVKLSLKQKVEQNEENDILEENNVFSSANFTEVKKNEEIIKVKSQELKNQNMTFNLLENKEDLDIKNMRKSFDLHKQVNCKKENENAIIYNTQISDEDLENHYLVKERSILENKKKNPSTRSIKIAAKNEIKNDYFDIEFTEDWENSKESNSGNVSDVEFYSSLDTRKSYLNDSFKQKTTEKLKRESEVWSEFYESLQLAEKLKKKKNLSFQRETEKSSFLPDYSSKRIVKKPKRYRQSSESEFSFEENDLSNSEPEIFNLKETFINKQLEEKVKKNDTDQIVKKQELLNKLQNVDEKFVNYLFDLIRRREKCFDLYKKHSSRRTNKHSQDLKIYRKKVLNGIKHRGRPLKILRDQETASEKDRLASTIANNLGETYCQRLFKKSSNLFGSNSKSSEKKRGRPRKIIDSTKVKERRRSDKEVDFIEKNFEKEENESSPSKRKRKLSSKLQYYKKVNTVDEKDDFSSGQLITNRIVDSSKKLFCAVCKEIFQEPMDFKEHIIMHRLEENTYQCMECGECFVVRPSLEKHLLAFHKIKNTDRYIIENQCCSTKKETSELEGEPLKENQCKVCKDQFDRAIDLTKHFRIHGMAFLKEFKKEGKIKV